MGLVPHSHHGLVSGYLGTVVSQSVRASEQHRPTNVSRHGEKLRDTETRTNRVTPC